MPKLKTSRHGQRETACHGGGLGHEVRAQDYRITAIVPGERMSKFVDGCEVDRFFEVEPL